MQQNNSDKIKELTKQNRTKDEELTTIKYLGVHDMT